MIKQKLVLLEEQQIAYEKLLKKRNNLLIAQTGAGKTIIALRSALDYINQNKKVLFLVPTNVLVEQHYQTFKKYMDPVYPISANSKAFSFERKGCYILTGALAKVLTSKNILDLKDVDFVIYDEAHKAISVTSSYAYIGSLFKKDMLALTASPGSTQDKKNICLNLNVESIVQAKSPFVYRKELCLQEIKQNLKKHKLVDALRAVLFKRFEKLTKTLNLSITCTPSYLVCRYKNTLQLKKALKKANISIQTYYYFFKYLYAFQLLEYDGYDSFIKYYDSNKVLKVSTKTLDLVKKYECNTKFDRIYELCMRNSQIITLVFFENWSTCVSCRDFLESKGVSNSTIAILAGKSKLKLKERNRILKDMTSIKIILATSVIEEGVNIRDVDHVIFHKPITSKIRIIQRQGRTARYKDGRISVLYYKNTFEQNIVRKIY